MAFRSIISAIHRFLLLYRVRITVVVAVFFLAKNFIDGVPVNHVTGPDDPLGLTGMGLIAAGAALRSWAAGMLRKNEELATQGPYALARHPLYLGSLLIALGICTVLSQAPGNFVALAVLVFLVYWPKIREEESLIRPYFGEPWHRYAERTALLFPKRFPRGLAAPWSARQWLKNKEYRAFLTCLGVLAVFELLYRYPIHIR